MTTQTLSTTPITARRLPFRALAMPLALLAIFVYFTVQSSVFLSSRNLSMLAIEVSITAVLALGMFLIILPGHIDLSAGSGVGLIGGVSAVLVFEHAWPAPLALLVGIIAAAIIWLGMGSIIIRERVPAFIITLGGLLVFRGLHWLVIHNATVPVSRGGEVNLYSMLTTYYLPPIAGYMLAAGVVLALAAVRWSEYRRRKASGIDGEQLFLQTFVAAQTLFFFVLICNAYRGIPLPALVLGCVAFLAYVLTTQTPFGRYLYAIGGNEEAAVVSGVPVAKVTIGAFLIMGLIVAITGFLQTAYSGASTTTVGSLMELDAVAACVIGGTSLKGGRGTVGGVLLGALIMAALLNGMTLLAVSPESKYIARGIVLALAVWADVRLGKK
ncbi:MAG: ATPase [Chthoniobacterales bacterium]